MYYGVYSNFYNVNGELRKILLNDMEGKVDTNSNYIDCFKLAVEGGEKFDMSSFSNAIKKADEWVETINTSPALIGTSSDGLVPLWKLLPSDYSDEIYTTKMMNWYHEYEKLFTPSEEFATEEDLKETFEYSLVREYEYTITDKGRFIHNQYDVIDFNQYTDSGLQPYLFNNYKTVDVNIKMQVKEKNKGYQYLFLYNDVAKSNHNKACDGIRFEYYGTELGKKYDWVEFNFPDVPIEQFTQSNQIVIRYGASGHKKDTWNNKDVYVQLQFKK